VLQALPFQFRVYIVLVKPRAKMDMLLPEDVEDISEATQHPKLCQSLQVLPFQFRV
jgi:hypothetical protein